MAGQGDVGQGYINEIIDLANSGNTSSFTKSDWQIIANNAGYETPRAVAARMASQKNDDTDTSKTTTTTVVDTRAQDRESASAFLSNLLAPFGLSLLASEIDTIIKETTNENVMFERLRNSNSYKKRFKGLTQLRAKGVTDIANEGEYLRLESNYRQVFRDAGMSSFLGNAGTETEFDAIAKLVGDYSVSVDEVAARVNDAQRIVAETPKEVRDSFQRFYNVDPSTLTAYVLDPVRTTNEINKRANAAMIGGLGMKQGLDFDVSTSARVGTFLGGDNNLTTTQVDPQLTQIADIQRSTGRLAELEKSTLSAGETALASLDLDVEAQRKVKGLQSRERARFSGSGAFNSSALKSGKKV